MNLELRDNIQPVRKWNPGWVWKVAQEGVINGVRAWQLWVCRTPPAQRRVTWSLQSSGEGQGVTLPFLNLKSAVPQVDLTLYLRNVYFSFLWRVTGGETRSSRVYFWRQKFESRSIPQWALCDCEQKGLFFFCNQLLIWEMRNGLKIVLKLSSSVNFP